tara:strand:- start:445 stop:1176 length:732 start_codon:yes stop_codon:yes gene_type:complete
MPTFKKSNNYTMKMNSRQLHSDNAFRMDSYAMQYNYAMKNENTRTIGSGKGARYVKQDEDLGVREISFYTGEKSGNRYAKNVLGGAGNRAEVIPKIEAIKNKYGSNIKPYYAAAEAITKDSLDLVNKGQGHKAQQLYGREFGRDFRAADNAGKLQVLVGQTKGKLRGTPFGGNYSGQAPKGGPNQPHNMRGSVKPNTPYYRMHPFLRKGKEKTIFYNDRQYKNNATRDDARRSINIINKALGK